MARLFISHSNRNNDKAIEVKNWLAANGWEDVFLDLDPVRGIAAGERWMEALQKAAYRCELVLALVSAEWIASGWCKSEVDAARLMGKKVIAALVGIDKAQVPPDLKAEQFIDLSGDPQAYQRLKEGLKRTGLDPTSFPFPAGRRPYPGFAYLEEEDAAVFFGRDAQIVRGIDLYDNYLADNALTRAGYDRIGRVKGVIAQTIGQAFAEAVARGEAPKDGDARLRLARSAFIPHLAQVNPAGEFVRRVSPRDKIPPEARPLVDRFAEQRLLIRDRTEGAEVVEVAHETLLRQPPFSDWLAKDREFLVWRERLSQARTAFEAKGRGLLVDIELKIASGNLETRTEREIESDDLAFVRDSMAAEAKRQAEEAEERSRREAVEKEEQERRIRDAERIIEEQRKALANLRDAQIAQSRFLADHARQSREAGDAGTAVLLALEALPDAAAGIEQPYVPEAELQLDSALRGLRERLDLGHDAAVWSVAFSPDGQRIVTASDDKTARVWDAASGEPIGEPLKGHKYRVYSAAFSPDGQRIVTASYDGTSCVWDAASGKAIGEPLGHTDEVTSAAFSPDGKRIVTVSPATARVWDAAIGKPIGEPLKDHASTVDSASFSPDGTRIVTASWDKTARIWDAATRKPIGEPLKGHEDRVRSAAFSHDGQRIVTASEDKTARIWDAATGKPIGEPLKGHEDVVTSAAFSPDGKRIATASWDKTARVWDAASRKPIGEPLTGHDNSVSSAAFSPDGKRIVTASDDKTARVRDAASRKPIGEPLTGHDNSVLSAAFSPDGKRIVTASDDKTARVWDAASRKPIGEPLTGHDNSVLSAAFSPDGQRIVTASWDKTARIWDAATRKPIGEPLKGHEAAVMSAAFSPDGKDIVTACYDKTAWVWDSATGQPIGEPLKGHEAAVWSASFSPDGKRIVTTSDDKTARVWDAASGQPIYAPLTGHGDAVLGAAFSPDGKRIVTASKDKTARVWDVDTQALVDRAKAAVPRCLTRQQRKASFLPPEPPAWCIEMEKWPYNNTGWKQWLSDKRAGKNPPLPPDLIAIP